LLIRGADVDKQSSYNRWTDTALTIAAKKGHLAIVNRLLEANAKVDQAGEDGERSLIFAAQNGHLDVVAKLIEAGASVNLTDKNGWTALMGAANSGHLSVVEKLIEVGAKVDSENKDKETALMFAAREGHLAIVERLVELGDKVNRLDNDGKTALMHAAKEGYEEIINALVTVNADHHLKDKDGKTAKDHAQTLGTPEYLQKCINDHQYSVLNELPAYQELFKEIPVCPISHMPITHLMCANIDGHIHRYEKGAIIQWLSSNNTCPMTRKPLSTGDYLSRFSENAEEQERIADLWNQVDIKYTEYKQGQLAQAQVSMFAEGAAAADSESGPATRASKRGNDGAAGAGSTAKKVCL
jgi:ankyrin repeat protein